MAPPIKTKAIGANEEAARLLAGQDHITEDGTRLDSIIRGLETMARVTRGGAPFEEAPAAQSPHERADRLVTFLLQRVRDMDASLRDMAPTAHRLRASTEEIHVLQAEMRKVKDENTSLRLVLDEFHASGTSGDADLALKLAQQEHELETSAPAASTPPVRLTSPSTPRFGNHD